MGDLWDVYMFASVVRDPFTDQKVSDFPDASCDLSRSPPPSALFFKNSSLWERDMAESQCLFKDCGNWASVDRAVLISMASASASVH